MLGVLGPVLLLVGLVELLVDLALQLLQFLVDGPLGVARLVGGRRGVLNRVIGRLGSDGKFEY